jgi:UDP-N-acetylglucosamine--N-acetylmuramyl-(pentapeptide) pyrophosphoryl-undecaprenol N-acetylglucosamine transferase
MPRALAMLAGDGAAPRFDVRHQTGDKHIDATRAAYAESAVTADVSAFITDMAEALAWADLVICRAGALTIAELAAAGIAAVLVPYPHAVDDHQTHNARFLVDAGAARLLADADVTPELLARELRELGADRARLLAMAEAARRVAKPDAAQQLLDACLAAEESA